MRKLMVIIFFCFIGLVAKSQNLKVEGTAPDLYISHVVAPKENFYSVARLYNQSPKLIASFNKIVMEKGLTIGQHVKIPLTAQNYDNTGVANEKSIPLTHTVGKSETLFRIGNIMNVAPESIRKWNRLSSDKIALGTPLVIGFLKTDNAQSLAGAAKNNKAAMPDNNNTSAQNGAVAEPKSVAAETKKDAPFTSVNSSADKAKEEDTPETKTPDRNLETGNGSKKSSAESKSTATEKDTALAVAADNSAAAAKEEPAKQQENLPAKKEESKTVNQSTETIGSTTGTFEELYAKQASQKSENTKSGEAATFKSTSGWQDKKYYVLINDVVPGTIVKISSSDKAVYAKVLGSMPEMKENIGLLLRISNAAASNLGIIDPKFSVQVSYY